MSYAQELALRYKSAHNRLMGEPPKPQTYQAPKPISHPEPSRIFPRLSTESPVIYDKPTFRQLLDWISAKEGVEASDIIGPKRDKRVAQTRKIFYYLAYEYAKATFTQIAKYCGKRDHTTVVTGFYRMCSHIENDRNWHDHMREYTSQLDAQIEAASKICPYCGK